MKNVYLFQPQYTYFFNDKLNNWIPYSVGSLWNYAQQFEDITQTYKLNDLIFKREIIDELLDRLEEPAICGFSCYVWNINYCLAVAEKVKIRWPNCVNVFGGPEISDRYIQEYKFIDFIIKGEGEQSFVNLLRSLRDNQQIDKIIPKHRMENLLYPGPYASGIFDKILYDNPDVLWSVTIETNRGCPYSCTFCDWGSLTYSKVKRFDLDQIKTEIDWIRNKPISYIFVADANFGMFKDRDLSIAKMLKDASDESVVDVVHLQGAKQSSEIAFEIGSVLQEKYAGVTVSMQSMNSDTLTAINRKNLATNDIKRIMELSDIHQIPTYSELILGLPCETKESWISGMCELLELGQHNSIDVWFAQLLENSELSTVESRQKYGIVSRKYSNYVNFKELSKYNKDGIKEDIELVVATNTMTTPDLIESYLYSWMIIQWHILGYSQIIAKYSRKANNILYRTFYDHLFEKIKNDVYFGKHYDNLYLMLKDSINDHNLYSDLMVSAHTFHQYYDKEYYSKKDELFNFVFKCANEISAIPDWVLNLQKSFVYDATANYPIVVDADYNLNTNTQELTTYLVISKNDTSLKGLRARRLGLYKNLIKVIDK